MTFSPYHKAVFIFESGDCSVFIMPEVCPTLKSLLTFLPACMELIDVQHLLINIYFVISIILLLANTVQHKSAYKIIDILLYTKL